MRKKIIHILLKCGFERSHIENAYIFLLSGVKRIRAPWVRFHYFFLRKIQKISDIEYELFLHLRNDPDIYAYNSFYQSYPPKNIHGMRDSLFRFHIFEMEKYLHRTDNVLDIGGNVGFFSLFIAPRVGLVDIVEKNKILTTIGERLMEYENIKNVHFITQDFLRFETQTQYDCIFSFAVHKWIGLDFQKYIDIVSLLLKSGGYLFMESQNLEIDPDFEKNILSCSGSLLLEKIFDIQEKGNYLRKGAILKKI